VQSGWYASQKPLLTAPLLDTTVADGQLAQWVDAHTMAVHRFLPSLHLLRRTGAPRELPRDSDSDDANSGGGAQPMWRLSSAE
jgi:hypothetical protein